MGNLYRIKGDDGLALAAFEQSRDRAGTDERLHSLLTEALEMYSE